MCHRCRKLVQGVELFARWVGAALALVAAGLWLATRTVGPPQR